MDGSEPGDTTPAAVLSGAPIELQARTVRYVKSQRMMWHILTVVASIDRLRLQHNQAIGTATNGAWTGIHWKRDIAGRIP